MKVQLTKSEISRLTYIKGGILWLKRSRDQRTENPAHPLPERILQKLSLPLVQLVVNTQLCLLSLNQGKPVYVLIAFRTKRNNPKTMFHFFEGF